MADAGIAAIEPAVVDPPWPQLPVGKSYPNEKVEWVFSRNEVMTRSPFSQPAPASASWFEGVHFTPSADVDANPRFGTVNGVPILEDHSMGDGRTVVVCRSEAGMEVDFIFREEDELKNRYVVCPAEAKRVGKTQLSEVPVMYDRGNYVVVPGDERCRRCEKGPNGLSKKVPAVWLEAKKGEGSSKVEEGEEGKEEEENENVYTGAGEKVRALETVTGLALGLALIFYL